MGCFCSSQSPADFDGIIEYTKLNQANIMECITKDSKDELKVHFALGWRTHHAFKEEKDVN
jgi:hypothetical protein